VASRAQERSRTSTRGRPNATVARLIFASAALFSIIPALFLIATFKLTKANGPQWLPYGFENSYPYLLNSLLVVKGQSPYHIDHPGTTTQVFGAIVLRTSSLKSADELVDSVLRDPERYIGFIHRALLIFTFLSAWICPWITAVFLRNYIVGLLIQAPILFFQSVLSFGVWLCSDLMVVPFCIASVCICCLDAAPSSATEKDYSGRSTAPSRTPIDLLIETTALPILNGLVCAFGLTTKLTFFPLVLISLLLSRSWKSLIAFVAAFALGLAASLLPIYSQLPRLGDWIMKLATHSGEYGTGPAGLPQAGDYFNRILILLADEPLVAIISIAAAITILVLLFRTTTDNKPSRAITPQVTARLFAGQLISFLALAKHPYGTNYLIPLCLSTGLNLVFLLYALRLSGSNVTAKRLGYCVLIALLVLGFGNFAISTPKTYAEARREMIDELRLYRRAQLLTKNDIRVDYYFSDSPEYALSFGNDFTGRFFSPVLARLHPNVLFLNVLTGRFQTFSEFEIPPGQIQKRYDHLYLLGDPTYFPSGTEFDQKTFETVDHAGEYYLQKWTRK
jgi:uncharacterized membrane protein